MAPLIPFVTEAMYQNLVRSHDPDARESVHQALYPEVDEALVDEALSSGMNAAIRIVGLGRAVREKIRIGVRQPLQRLVLASSDGEERKAAERFQAEILEELNVKELEVREANEILSFSLRPNGKVLGPRFGKEMKDVARAVAALDAQAVVPDLRAGQDVEIVLESGPVALTAEDLLVDEEVAEGFSVATDLETTLALDIRLSPELKREGLARQIVRSIQNLRKEVGLEIENRIRLRIVTDDVELRDAIEAHGDQIQTEVLARELHLVDSVSVGHEVEVRRKPRSVMVVEIERVGG
jgi:isoleucyl-tRNA synthetase